MIMIFLNFIFILNLYHDVCQLYLNTTGKRFKLDDYLMFFEGWCQDLFLFPQLLIFISFHNA